MRMGFFKFALIFASILSAVCGYVVYRSSLDFYEFGTKSNLLQVKLSSKDDVFYKIVRTEIIKSGVDDNYDTNLNIYEKMFSGVLPKEDIKNTFEACKSEPSCVGPSTVLLRQYAEKQNTVKKFDAVIIKKFSTKFDSESISGPSIEYKVIHNGGEVEYVANNMEKIQKNWENINRLGCHRALEDSQWYALISSITLLLFTVLMFRRK